MDEPIRYFVPGPAFVLPEVRAALAGEIVPHRSPAFTTLYAEIQPRLEAVFRSAGDVLMATASSTFVMEASLVSCVENDVLNLTCGAFSERWHAIARSLGKRADRVSVPWGEAVDPDLVRAALRRRPYEAVTVVHSETSTGVLNPVREIAGIVREESDALVLVDAVSSLAGVPLESAAWGLDVVLAGSQKALALPPGLTLFTLSDRAAERAARRAHRGFYTDLLRYRDKHRAGGTITTPAISIVYALAEQLNRIEAEGIEERWRRHRDLARRTTGWAEASSCPQLAPPGARSWTVSCLRAPPGISAPEIVAAAERRGFQVGNGYGKLKEKTFRIGHMGEVRTADLEALLAVLDECIIEARV